MRTVSSILIVASAFALGSGPVFAQSKELSDSYGVALNCTSSLYWARELSTGTLEAFGQDPKGDPDVQKYSIGFYAFADIMSNMEGAMGLSEGDSVEYAETAIRNHANALQSAEEAEQVATKKRIFEDAKNCLALLGDVQTAAGN